MFTAGCIRIIVQGSKQGGTLTAASTVTRLPTDVYAHVFYQPCEHILTAKSDYPKMPEIVWVYNLLLIMKNMYKDVVQNLMYKEMIIHNPEVKFKFRPLNVTPL